MTNKHPTSILATVITAFLLGSKFLAEALQLENANETNTASPDEEFSTRTWNDNVRPPMMHTYFERIPAEVRTTGMTNAEDDALLEFWNTSWSGDGWQTRILTLKDAKQHANYEWLQQRLDDLRLDAFACVLFHRWMAMAVVGGGWYTDMDVFPMNFPMDDPSKLPNSGRMSVLDILSPTMASGNASQWNSTLFAMIEDAIAIIDPEQSFSSAGSTIGDSKKKTFWTDSLAIHRLVVKYGKNVEPTPALGRLVFSPYDERDPVVSGNVEDCQARLVRKKWVVHFGPEMLHKAPHLPFHLRLPKHRLSLAQAWLPKFRRICRQEEADANDTTVVSTG